MLNSVRLATRRKCEAHARPKAEAVRLWPWHVPDQSEAALVIEALKDAMPGIRFEGRPDPHPARIQDSQGEIHLVLGSGKYRVPGGFGTRTFLHADTLEEAELLRKLYQAAWNELCRFRQKWTR